jgi:hypothetical protein
MIAPVKTKIVSYEPSFFMTELSGTWLAERRKSLQLVTEVYYLLGGDKGEDESKIVVDVHIHHFSSTHNLFTTNTVSPPNLQLICSYKFLLFV